ncbi:hypothetical protein [Neisseria shayeganii]|nr:hypothetical protein [Neisseria shayeganii]
MKKYLPLLLVAAVLSGCDTWSLPKAGGSRTQQHSAGYTLAPTHWSDVSKIRNEATRLGYEVSRGRMTKAQAAQQLNRFRINLVGRNMVDDDMYEIYLRSAVQSQQGRITSAQSKTFVQNALRGWQQRWPNMQNKPTNPAFTNFLMEVMGMEPLK